MKTEQAGEIVRPPEKRWYVIHTYSGYENKVKANLEHRIESMGMDDKIFQVLVLAVSVAVSLYIGFFDVVFGKVATIITGV